MSQLNINGNIYAGEPLTAFTFDGEYWSGNSNFLAAGQTEATVSLKDLEDCFTQMKL